MFRVEKKVYGTLYPNLEIFSLGYQHNWTQPTQRDSIILLLGECKIIKGEKFTNFVFSRSCTERSVMHDPTLYRKERNSRLGTEKRAAVNRSLLRYFGDNKNIFQKIGNIFLWFIYSRFCGLQTCIVRSLGAREPGSTGLGVEYFAYSISFDRWKLE